MMVFGLNLRSWSRKKQTAAIAILATLAIAGWRVHAQAQAIRDCPVALVDHEIIGKTCPVVGHMGNVKLAIPQHYILGPVAYKGVDIWNAESYRNRPRHPTLDTEISNFSIKIRLNNFKPVESYKDARDYDKLGGIGGWKQSPENRWIFVGFQTLDEEIYANGMKNTFDNWLKDKTLWGPYKELEPIWGLRHYISVQQPSTKNDQYEILYDSKSDNTFIYCANSLIATPPYEPFVHCHFNFLIRDMNLLVEVSNLYHKDDFVRWQEIEHGIKKVVQSFVVP